MTSNLPLRGVMDRPVALTLGDPAGIGPDITLGAWQRLHGAAEGAPDSVPFFVLADPDLVQARAQRLGADVPIKVIGAPCEAMACFARALPVLPLANKADVAAGQPDPQTAPAILEAISRAVALTLEGKAAAVVTNPIAKQVLYRAGFAHPGHTEFLGALARQAGFQASPVMMLAGGGLRVGPVTIHIPLSQVPARLTTERIVETAQIVAAGLVTHFGISRPRLALAGLNPHAGEEGTMGREDMEVVAPAVRALQQAGINASGPLPADTMFHQAARQTYDVALGMYHDQVLIPLKTLAFDEGVNVTLGLPFVRTSPDHGTAFAIAGTGRAASTSLIAALKLAGALAARKRAGEQMKKQAAPCGQAASRPVS